MPRSTTKHCRDTSGSPHGAFAEIELLPRSERAQLTPELRLAKVAGAACLQCDNFRDCTKDVISWGRDGVMPLGVEPIPLEFPVVRAGFVLSIVDDRRRVDLIRGCSSVHTPPSTKVDRRPRRKLTSPEDRENALVVEELMAVLLLDDGDVSALPRYISINVAERLIADPRLEQRVKDELRIAKLAAVDGAVSFKETIWLLRNNQDTRQTKETISNIAKHKPMSGTYGNDTHVQNPLELVDAMSATALSLAGFVISGTLPDDQRWEDAEGTDSTDVAAMIDVLRPHIDGRDNHVATRFNLVAETVGAPPIKKKKYTF